MALVYYFWVVIQFLIGYNLILPLILFLVYALRKSPSSDNNNYSSSSAEEDYAIIITAFQQTDLLPNAVESILHLNYSNFLVYVVADDCDVSNLAFDDERVTLLCPNEVLASNTASHFFAIRNFKRQHTRLTIIDSDNLVHGDFLIELNRFFDQGYSAVQGLRKAKNLDSTYACLDAARDIYYHFYDGKLLFNLGSSATLAGSAMAFETDLYRQCLENREIKGAGFDKILQFEIVKRGLKIAFASRAIVYDEKTSQSPQLIKQRSRWINTWFKYFGFGFILLRTGVFKMDLNQTLFGLVLLRPPLFIFLILSVLCLLINLWLSLSWVWLWSISIIIFVIGFMLALIVSRTPKIIYNSLIMIPKFIYLQVKSLIKIKSAEKISIATEHYYKNIKVNDNR